MPTTSASPRTARLGVSDEVHKHARLCARVSSDSPRSFRSSWQKMGESRSRRFAKLFCRGDILEALLRRWTGFARTIALGRAVCTRTPRTARTSTQRPTHLSEEMARSRGGRAPPTWGLCEICLAPLCGLCITIFACSCDFGHCLLLCSFSVLQSFPWQSGCA